MDFYLKSVEKAIANKQREAAIIDEELENLKNQKEKILIQIRERKKAPCNCKICRSGGLPY